MGYFKLIKGKILNMFFLLLLNFIELSGQIPVSVTNPLNTTPPLSASYTSLADALNALNATTAMTGPVILTCASGSSETAPPAGLTIGSATLNPVLNSTNTVTVNTSGGVVTLNAGVGIATPTNPVPDGILKISGADYVTVDGLTITDGNITNPETMEFGIALFKSNLSDGASNNTIKNCILNMQRINNAAATAPMVEGAVGILVINSTISAATTSLVPTTAAGSNSNNKIYSNTINGGNHGIAIIGYATFSSPYIAGDANNDIGGLSLSTGNSILNFGGGGSTSQANGIYTQNQWTLNISYNTINNNNGSGVNHTTFLRGIYSTGGTNANATIGNNIITLKGGGTTTVMNAINSGIGNTGTSNTVNIVNNTIQNCTYTTSTTGQFHVIQNSSGPFTFNVTGNIINNNSLAGSSQSIIIGGANEKNLNVTSNVITSFTRTGSGGVERGIDILNATNTFVDGNIIDGISFSNSGIIYGVYSLTAATNVTISNNTIRNLSVGTGTIIGVYETGGSGTKLIRFNEIYNFITTPGGSGVYNFDGIRVEVGNCDISNNKIYSLNSGGTPGSANGGQITGIYLNSSGTNTVNNNRICDLSGVSSTVAVYGLYILATNSNTFSNNRISDLRTPFATLGNLIGINIAATTTAFVYNNSVYLNATSSGTGFGSTAIQAIHTATLTLNNNIFVNTSIATGTGRTVAYKRTSTSLATYNSSSDRNLFYAPVIFYDQTNTITSLGPGAGSYKNMVSPRDANSISEIPPFLSTTCGDPNFLKINTSVMTDVESGGSNIAGITTDFENEIRYGNAGYTGTGTLAPDIGADEFNGLHFPKCSGTPAATSISNAASVCINNGTLLSLNTTYSETGYQFQWKSSTSAGGPYSNMDVMATQSTGNLSVTTYYVCSITCGNSGLSFTTPEISILVNPLPVVSANPANAVYCSPGSAVTLTSSGASTYSWTPSTGLSQTTGSVVSASPSSSVTYTVTGTDLNGCTASATSTITSGIIPTVLSVSATPSSICANSTTTLSASGGQPTTANNYLFSSGTGTLDPMTGATTIIGSPAVFNGSGDDTPIGPLNIGFNFSYNGIYYSEYSISPDGWILLGNATPVSQYINSVVSSTNIPKIYPLWSDLCTGTNGNVKVLLKGNAPNRILIIQWFVTIPRNLVSAANSTFQLWLFENSLIEFHYGVNGTVSSASSGLTGSTTLFRSVTFSNNTSSTSVANNNNTAPPANGRVYTFTLPTGSLTYSWTPAALVNSPNSQTTPTVSLPSTTTYTATITNGVCSSTATTSVNIIPVSCQPLTVSSVRCAGNNFTVTGNPANGVGPYQYAWSDGIGGVYPNSQTINVNQPAGNYTISCLITDACLNTCSTSVLVTVNALPVVSAGNSFSRTCISNLTGAAIGEPNDINATYAWFPTTGLSSSTISNPTANPVNTTTYTVTKTSTITGCVSTAAVTATVDISIPTVSAGSAFTKTCITNAAGKQIGETNDVTATYSWSPISGLSSSTISNPVANPSATTIYTVTKTKISNGCTASATVTATVNTTPPVVSAGNPFTKTCVSNTSGLQIGELNDATATYSWSPISGLSSATISNPVANPSATTTYTVTKTKTSNGCTTTATVIVTVNNTAPSVSAGSAFTKTCISNQTGAQIGETNDVTASYSWNPAAGLSSSTISNPVANPTSTTIYTVTKTRSASGCTATSTVTVTVNTTAPIVSAGSAFSKTCVSNTSGAQIGESNDVNATYSWSPAGGLSSITISNPNANPSITTIYTVTKTNNNNGCTSSASVTATVNNTPPPLNAGSDFTKTCVSNISGLQIGESNDPNAIYSWSPGAGLSSTNISNPLANPAVTTTYSVTKINTSSLCVANAAVTVTVNTTPPSASASSNSPVCIGSTLNLSSAGGSTYSWTGPDNFTSNIQNPIKLNAGNINGGNYLVIVTGSNGCTSSASTSVSLQTPVTYFADSDNDGFGVTLNSQQLCSPSGIFTALTGGDCNDNNNQIRPGVTEICNNNIDDDCDGMIDENCYTTLHLRVFIEGFYLGDSTMTATIDPFLQPNICDTVSIELKNTSYPFNVAYFDSSLLHTNGFGDFEFPLSAIGSSYYIVVRHRNALETWSSSPVMFNSIDVNYSFATTISSAFGNNMRDLGDGKFALWSGDIIDGATSTVGRQDGIIESEDFSSMENALTLILTGYNPQDITGDGVVESADYSMIENNVSSIIFSIHP